MTQPRLIVIDTETCSTEQNAALLSIGGVQVLHSNDKWVMDNVTFYEELDVKDQVSRGADFDVGTIAWHLKGKQTNHELSSILNKRFESGHNRKVLHTFQDWWYGPNGVCNNLLICRGTDFDPPIIRNMFKRYEEKAPYNYGQCVDLRSLETTMGLLGQPVSRLYNAQPHHALEDAIEEAKQLVTILNNLGGFVQFFMQMTSAQVVKEKEAEA